MHITPTMKKLIQKSSEEAGISYKEGEKIFAAYFRKIKQEFLKYNMKEIGNNIMVRLPRLGLITDKNKYKYQNNDKT